MDTPAHSSNKHLSLVDIHRAIETLAIAQAQIGIAVLRLLDQRSMSITDPAELHVLSEKVETSVSQLHGLASSVMAIPYDS